MPSEALRAFKTALGEILDLRSVARPSLAWSSLRLARAAGRAQAVLLSAHFERYLYAINEEAIEFLNGRMVLAPDLGQID